MAIYSIASSVAPAANISGGAPAFEIFTSSSDNCTLFELGFSSNIANNPVGGLGRPGIKGVTPGGTSTVIPEDTAGPAGTTQVATSWGTSPTMPASFLRKFWAPNGAFSLIWTFSRGIVILVSSSLVLWLTQGNALTLDFWIVVDE